MNLVEKQPMVPLSVFLPQLLLSAPQIPEGVAESYIRDAAILLAEQSMILKRTVAIPLQAGCGEALLEPPDCTHTWAIDRVCDFMGRWYTVLPDQPCMVTCGSGLGPSLSALSCCVSGAQPVLPPNSSCGPICEPGVGWWWGSPFTVWFEQPNHLRIQPLPQVDVEDMGLRVRLTVLPDRDACELDELIYQRYSPVVVAGALSLLYAMPNVDGSAPWSAPALAKLKEREFKVGCARAFGDALVGVAKRSYRMTAQRII